MFQLLKNWRTWEYRLLPSTTMQSLV